MNKISWISGLMLLFWANGLMAATCTSKASGNWSSSSTWSCNAKPGSADTVIIASPNSVTVNASVNVAAITVSSGGTLDISGSTLTVSGNIANNGTVTDTAGSGILQSTGNSAVISGTGSFAGRVRLYTTGTGPSVALGSTLTFADSASIRAGRNGGSTITASILTINGTLATTQTAGINFLRLYANSTIISSTGVINAANSTLTYQATTATLTNNGSVILQKITQSGSTNTNKWTQGANATLTLALTSTVGTLYASAAGNTVTYNGTAATNVAITTLSPVNTYYNLAGTAVVCPTSFVILGSSPCTSGIYAITQSPTSCVTGTGSVAWATPANAYSSDNVFTTAANVIKNTTTNYLRCTGYNFTIPMGATINGIVVNVERKSSGGSIKDSMMRLVKNVGGVATIQTAERFTLTSYLTTDVIEAHGGVSDLWGGTWSVADINSANFGAAFAAYNTSTSSSTNRTVSVDHMPITVIYTPVSSPDHVSISASNTGSVCNSNSVVVSLHNTSHAAVSGWGGAISLSTSDNKGDWTIATGAGILNNGTSNDGAATYTYSAAESSVTFNLSHTTTGTITVGVANAATGLSLLTNTPVAEKRNTINYPAGGSFSVVSNATGTPVSVTNLDQISGQASATYYLYAVSSACSAAFANTTKTIQFATECNDPVACQNSPSVVTITPGGGVATSLQKGLPSGTQSPTASQYTNVVMAFNGSSRAPFTLSYADVGKITLYMNYTSGSTSIFSETNPFVVSPAGFVLSGIKRSSDNFTNPAAYDATGVAFIKSGNLFSATVTALTASGAVKANSGNAVNCATNPIDCAPNFGQELNQESVLLTPLLVSNLGLTNVGMISGTFGGFIGGSASGTAFSWDEVGIITLTPSIMDADYLGGGDVTGTVSANVGRFYPDHFRLTQGTLDGRDDLNLCSQGFMESDGETPCTVTFTYMAETIMANFTLFAENLGGFTTQNYTSSALQANNFAKLNPIEAGSDLGFGAVDTVIPTNLTSRVDTSMISLGTGTFNSGKADVAVPISLTRAAIVDGPYAALNIGIAPVDSDGVAISEFDLNVDATAGNDHSLIAGTEVRYGRLNLQNASGSELLDLLMSMMAEYWNGTNWVINADDQDTIGISLSGNSVTGPLASVCAWDTGVGTGNSGLGCSIAGSGLNEFNEPPLVGNFNLNFKAPGIGNSGAIDITATCPTYLKFNWKGAGDICPTARATFGIYKGNSHFIYFRELF